MMLAEVSAEDEGGMSRLPHGWEQLEGVSCAGWDI